MSTVTGTTLLDVVPVAVRKAVYSTFGTLGVAVGGAQVAYSAAGLAQPTWLTVATAVLVFLGIPVSATALLNTPTKAAPAAPIAPVPPVVGE
jgi:hypothetical protein